jgi:hypothetical protein
MTNWGTFSPKQYRDKAVFNVNHPEHAELLAVMRDPRLRRPEVIIGSLGQFLPTSRSASVELTVSEASGTA